MKSSKRHIISTALLILFSFIQLSDLHIVGHDDNDVDCEMCQLAPENLDDNFIPIDSIETPKVVSIPLDQIQINSFDIYFDRETYYSFLNKAPPVV
ncbi:hypothetical protein SAMN04487910_1227 [Aquimarina amphilecti]|uniref:Uncharacterized protein n=1 Tax=Aquimarina amphilecti TaxID=1038014 RepID=A0A1H7K861_AQUAM|nr:hypothetical protein [Aquimarina amphilecti]SEK82656.1 hypothetical protein SAMN04487910_1227 [Aquimarina amphilecti]